MKKILTLLFLVISYLNYAQGNLQFNRVINHVIPAGNGNASGIITGSVTIPSNKVWKIESCGYKSAGNPYWSLILDNYVLFSYSYYPASSINPYWQPPYPIWLPAGTYAWKAQYYNNAAGFFEGASISIIEYNIVP
jgi:hypothetical protein